ncbi:MAG: Uncharacterized protein G01um101472_304 [Parcubacteria group bacterium Gr01-1014_72]|nr:MAG: Uncharacterized protein G01um101472_304 [Parcubacteria group bacterium Gr01-1014_72]
MKHKREKSKRVPPCMLHASCSMFHGFSLIEIIVYVSLLSLLFIVVVSTLLAMTRSFATIRTTQHIQSAALFSLDRMVREIRDGASVNTAQSVLGSHPGVLYLNTTDAASAARTVEFFVSGTTLTLRENGVIAGPLTPEDARVVNLVFRRIDTPHSEGVKIELVIEAGTGSTLRSETFYTTAVMRESY